MWKLLLSGEKGLLREPAALDYVGMLEGMEAAELLALVEMARRRLAEMEVDLSAPGATDLYIDRHYRIHTTSFEGRVIPFRPLVQALFILFLKHPEGILLKDRARFQEELEDIYQRVAPHVSPEDRCRRVRRLMDVQDNSFSENLSVLNATLGRVFPPPQDANYKIRGCNGHPRRIPLSPLQVHWE